FEVFQLTHVSTKSLHTFAVYRSERGPERGYEFVRTCIDACKRHHGATCARDGPVVLPGLRLIDVETKAIVGAGPPRDLSSQSAQPMPMPMPYVALSYEGDSDELPNQLPAVVQDAMTVCKDLGIQYLWVDKYCIRQNDAEEKHNQIRNMDIIYSAAELTIIAACSENSSEGLQGVSRPRAPPCRIGNISLFPMHES
ncbi:hypothetical protein PG989_015684, partial [Apiospora arundinis]